MTDQEALQAFIRQAAGSLTDMFNFSLRNIDYKEAMTLAADIECGRAELVFKTIMGQQRTVISGSLLYQDGREVPCFENTVTAPTINTGAVH
jgi:hypothetical protein